MSATTPPGDEVRDVSTIGLVMSETAPRVQLRGELTLRTERMLADYLETALMTFAGRQVELDLRGVDLIDPGGVALLVRLRRAHPVDRLVILPSEAVVRTIHFVANGERNRGAGGSLGAGSPPARPGHGPRAGRLHGGGQGRAGT